MKFSEIYFHTVAIAVSAGFLSGLAGVAQAADVMGQTQDHYKVVIQQKPYRVEVCKDVTVSGDKTGDALTGAIIGGIIGNNVTKNVDNGGAVGALLGGIIGHNNSDAKGGTQRQCNIETRYEEESREVYSHSTITFWENGVERTLRYTR
jgi:uncharacterized protein YcfJ